MLLNKLCNCFVGSMFVWLDSLNFDFASKKLLSFGSGKKTLKYS